AIMEEQVRISVKFGGAEKVMMVDPREIGMDEFKGMVKLTLFAVFFSHKQSPADTPQVKQAHSIPFTCPISFAYLDEEGDVVTIDTIERLQVNVERVTGGIGEKDVFDLSELGPVIDELAKKGGEAEEAQKALMEW
ncbi:hypothetical protein HDU67_003995, partial [Dinochytrium kinnereticum]